VNKWSETTTYTTGTVQALTLKGPATTDNYTGSLDPTTMEVYKDNVYGTLMLYPVPYDTTVFIGASSGTISTGQSDTLTASVVSTLGGYTPSGTVTFMDGCTTLSTPPVALNGSGSASLSISTLTTGVHHITAVYSGEPGVYLHNISNTPVTVTVQ
jgi:hypothetical protein